MSGIDTVGLPRRETPPAGTVAWLRGVWDVVVLEAKQRLRSRGWYIMLAVWFVLVGIVTWLTWASWSAQQAAMRSYAGPGAPAPASPGNMIFEVVLAFVLFLALVVAPALSANAVSGDRAQGTLAILQATLLRPGQILAGKALAAWFASLAFLVAAAPFLIIGVAAGGLSPGYIAVSLAMLAVELAFVCVMGTAISAIAARPLFSIVVTYLAVAMLTVGTLIAFGLGTQLARGTVMVNNPQYGPVGARMGEGFSTPTYTCSGTLHEVPALRTERVAWILAVNPFVVVADAIPYPDRSTQTVITSPGAIEGASQAARAALAGPEATHPCANGLVQPGYLAQKSPIWPLGLGVQIVLAAVLAWAARRALVTPARRLRRGTRVA